MTVQDDAEVEDLGQASENTYISNASDTSTTIDCGSSLDISMVKAFRESLMQAISLGKPIILDAEHVENADGAALQLLYAFFHEAKVKELELSWNEPSGAIKRSATLLGLSDQLLLH